MNNVFPLRYAQLIGAPNVTDGGVVSQATTLNVELARPVKVPSVAVIVTAVPVVRNVVVSVMVDCPAVNETPVVYVHELGPE